MAAEEASDKGPIDSVDGEAPEEQLVPFHHPDVEREQEMLDSMPLPGVPKDEAERRRKWSKLSMKVRAAIRALHRMLGHKPRSALLQTLKG